MTQLAEEEYKRFDCVRNISHSTHLIIPKKSRDLNLNASDFVMNWKCTLLIIAYQHAYQHYHRAAHLYLALDDHERNMNRRVSLRELRKYALHHIGVYANGLNLLHASIPDNQDTRLDQAWRWLLVQLGTDLAFVWLAWDELSQFLLLKMLIKAHKFQK